MFTVQDSKLVLYSVQYSLLAFMQHSIVTVPLCMLAWCWCSHSIHMRHHAVVCLPEMCLLYVLTVFACCMYCLSSTGPL